MATWQDVRTIALDLPGAVEDASGSTTAWRIGTKAFAWERPLRPSELGPLGDRAPAGPALGLRVPDHGAREALVLSRPDVFFLVPFYAGHPMVLVHVEAAPFDELDEAVTESWLCRAPKRMVRDFLAGGDR